MEPLNKKKIGIITGAGPEAGIDLWNKILEKNKNKFQDSYQGDLDAPYVVVRSIPALGNVMDIENHEADIWEILKDEILKISDDVDYFCIACNVLHFYSDQIIAMGLKEKFISIIDATQEYLEDKGVDQISLLSISKVLEFGKYSPYSSLKENLDVEVPNIKETHNLIKDIKVKGATNEKVLLSYQQIINKLDSELIVLACTELPLLSTKGMSKKFIDPTEILAEKMITVMYSS